MVLILEMTNDDSVHKYEPRILIVNKITRLVDLINSRRRELGILNAKIINNDSKNEYFEINIENYYISNTDGKYDTFKFIEKGQINLYYVVDYITVKEEVFKLNNTDDFEINSLALSNIFDNYGFVPDF